MPLDRPGSGGESAGSQPSVGQADSGDVPEATRRAFFDRVIAEKGMIAGYHFGFPNVGTLSKDGNGYAFAAVKA